MSVLCFFASQEPLELFQVSVQCQGEQERIKIWQDKDGYFYIFLPGHVDLETAFIKCNTGTKITMNNVSIYDGMSCEQFTLGIPYDIEYSMFGIKQKSKITILKSNGISSIFLDTASGSMEYIHASKSNEETGSIRLYESDGSLNCNTDQMQIKGRGNYSWVINDKKPYNLVFKDEINLLGLGTGRKWVLLSNSADGSHMRNKIVFDFAQEIGFPFSADCCWVELYFNGVYRGLYLLTEAVETGIDHENVSLSKGALFAVETEDILLEKNETYFLTDAGVPVEVCFPMIMETTQLTMLQTQIQSVENAILAEDGVDTITGKHWNELIDIDSWAKKYLIDEVFGNPDSFVRSAYFYSNDESALLYAGPIWDYDVAIGSEDNWRFEAPQTFMANRPAASVGWDTPWIYSLYQKEIFFERVIEIYRDVFLPELEVLLEKKLSEYTTEISSAAKMDDIRWNGGEQKLIKSVDRIRDYMSQRIAFLSDVWCRNKDYHVVKACQTITGKGYVYYVVFLGDKLSSLPKLKDTEFDRFVGWVNSKTGEYFDPSKPITEDVEIYTQWEDKLSKKIGYMVKLLPLGVITVIGLGLLATDIQKRHR